MEKNSTSNRLHALDGVRAVAILLVLFTHINVYYSEYIATIIPRFFIDPLFGSGVTGVSLLFVLSGFFMSYMYARPKNPINFLQKRYTRIFPLFIAVTSSLMVIRLMPHIAWYFKLGTIMSIAILVHVFWVYGIRKTPIFFRRYIFYSFVLLQIAVVGLYSWILKHPPIFLNQQLPMSIREGAVWLVNSTLTLPLGDYIPMLDGVYWSLVAEVTFYILYPFLCVPIVSFFLQKPLKIKILGIITVAFFFLGFDILFHNLFLLSMLQASLCFYFVTGIILGYLYKKHLVWFQQKSLPFLSWFSIIFFFLVIFLKIFVFKFFDAPNAALIHIVWAIPITLVIALSLSEKTLLSKILRNRLLVFIGTISYSMYLVHVPILQILSPILKNPNSFFEGLIVCFVFAAIISVASLLYYLLERPYFAKDKNEKKKTEEQSALYHSIIQKPKVAIGMFLAFSFMAVVITYQSRFNFFSAEKNYSKRIFFSPQISNSTESLSMKDYPTVLLRLSAEEDNFGILRMHITRIAAGEVSHGSQTLRFRIREENNKEWYLESTFDLAVIGNSREHLFGFPTIADSKGKTYIVELSLTNPEASDYIRIDTSDIVPAGIYNLNKSELLHHPSQLTSLLVSKITHVKNSKDAQKTVLLFLPFTLLCGYLYIRQKSIS